MKQRCLAIVLLFLIPVCSAELVYPNGTQKAVIFSYDDGVVHDRKLVQLFNQYQVVGTFNLSSGLFDQKAPWLKNVIGKVGEYVSLNEVAILYAGHEIAGHSHTHPGLAGLESDELFRQVHQDQRILSQLKNARVQSFAYPLGSFDDNAKQALAKMGFTNARTVTSSGSFDLPMDLLEWHPTIHHKDALPVIEAYKQLKTDELTVLVIWGHSWEFDLNEPNNSWSYMEELLAAIAHREDTWYVSAGDFVAFLNEKVIVK